MIKSQADTRMMFMDWDQLFLKKEDWQQRTFEMIKNDLISARDNRFVRYDNTEEHHLVMIYGKSQVGKTTLILNMIGIKSDCFFEVYETLRAGVPRGNSSTSTAIIYSRSVNEQYGSALTSINDISSRNIQYFDKKDMICYLEGIRNQVESNKVSTDSILFIYIPKSYFIQDSTVDNISIMDMPGIESRNHKEDIHVQNLMTKYIPISSVCIITCRCNDIQSLEALVLPNGLDWKRMEHRFILVITHAYNDGTTKRYFKTKPLERKIGFYDYVTEVYTQEIRKILGAANQTEVYPIDVGDTLARLCNEEIKEEADRNEVITTKDRVLSDLRKSIVSHKGERLKAALMDLEVIIKNYGEDKLQRIAVEITDHYSKIKDKERLIFQTKSYLEQLDGGEQNDLLLDIDELKENRNQFSLLLSGCISSFSLQTKQYIMDNSLYKSEYLKDKERAVLNNMRTNISEKVDTYTKKLNKLIHQTGIDITLNAAQIQNQADALVLQEEDSLYPPKNGLFSRRKKVFLENIESVCLSIECSINNLLNGYVNNCIIAVNRLIYDKQKRINKISSLILKQKSKCNRYDSEICFLKTEIKALQELKDDVSQKLNRDQQILAMYLKYAKQAYEEQRKDIIRQINSSENADDKLFLILFLGVLDKDYQKVTGGIYEDSNQYAIAK